MRNVLIFGANGSIGSHLYNSFKELGYNTFGTTTKNNINNLLFIDNNNFDNLLSIDKLDSVIWAQGININDNITSFNESDFLNVFNINVLFILKSLNYLLNNNKLNDGSKLVIISSIFEKYTRNNKLSYTISKSALSGLVKNIAYDLSKKNILINNILPGVIDNEMTRNMLNEDNINYVENYLHFKRLINLKDIFNAVKYYCIDNTGITGESVCIDLGFTKVRKFE
jgi:NAD(P)-dependent dehydrogenase (short-subunit alcohol dehydrogenase family)